MFDSITDLTGKLAETGYFIDPVMAQVVFLADKLKKPLLLEGPAAAGKRNWLYLWRRRRARMWSGFSATRESLRTSNRRI